MLFPSQIITLNKKDTELLGSELSLVLDEYESTYSQLFDNLRVWWSWYDSIPHSKSKDFPFKGASNIVIPLIAIMSDSFVANLYSSIFGTSHRIWSTFTENESMEGLAKNVGRHINWAARNDFNFRLPIYDWLSELVPMGSSVIAGGWRTDVRSVFSNQGRGTQRRIVAKEVQFGRGALFEHVPREQILWDTQFPISEAPFVAREFRYTWSQLANFAQTNPGWDKEAVEKLRGKGSTFQPSRRVTQAKEEVESRTAGHEYLEEHDIRQVWADWPILRQMGFDKREEWRPGSEDIDTPSIPLVATIHRDTRQILQLKAAPYFWPGNPFFDGFIRKRSGRGHAVGLAKRLEHSQLGMTTALNQAFDARTRANSIWAKTTSRALLSEPIDPSHPFYVGANMDAFQEMTLPTNNFQDLALVQILQTIAERLTGQSDPNFGQNTRQGGHPAPATSTIALLQQGDAQAIPTKDLLRVQIARMGQFAATLYQQFEADEDGRLRRIFGDRDAKQVEEWLYPAEAPIYGNIEFDVASMSQSHSPQAEMNRAIQVSQMNTNYWAFVMRAVQMMSQSPSPQLTAMAVKSIEAQTTAHMKFLEASDIDDIERFVLEIRRAQDSEASNLQRAVGGLGELARAGAGVANPGMGGAPLALGPGASGSLGAIGGF